MASERTKSNVHSASELVVKWRELEAKAIKRDPDNDGGMAGLVYSMCAGDLEHALDAERMNRIESSG